MRPIALTSHHLAVLALGLAVSLPLSAQEPELLPRAHSHNDYVRDLPLQTALKHGFLSVEADIFPVAGELRVGHDHEELKPGRTLEGLYLQPLSRRCSRHAGRVYPGASTFTLLVDIKADGQKAYAILRRRLQRYRAMLTRYARGKTRVGGVRVILSGDRPIDAVTQREERLVALAGRLADLERNPDPHLYPLISAPWPRALGWRGRGPMPPEQLERLRSWIARAHANGQQIRFWALPLDEAVWRVVYDEGVDLLNFDHLARARRFLLKRRREERADTPPEGG